MTNMMNVTETSEPRKIPKAPEDRPLPAKNFCTLCMYNIPSGSLMILIPGLVLLLTGIAVMSWTEVDSSWNNDLTTTSLIFLILGAALTFGGIVYWCVMWVRYKPKVTNKRKTVHVAQRSDNNVELVAVHTHEKVNPAYLHDISSEATFHLAQRSDNNVELVAVHTHEKVNPAYRHDISSEATAYEVATIT